MCKDIIRNWNKEIKAAKVDRNFTAIDIAFTQLETSHFTLLLKWLQAPHVKKWWDEGINYTMKLINDKYISYTQGYKISEGLRKSIYSYIINFDNIPIGYIQFYNFYDFTREYDLISNDLPCSLAALDIFIGEIQYTNMGLGAKILELFTLNYVFKKFKYCFVDPQEDNIAAIKAYENAGFKTIKSPIKGVTWLMKRDIL